MDKNNKGLIENKFIKDYIKSIKPRMLKCSRCNHIWLQKTKKKPKNCSKCNSPYFNKPKQKDIKEKMLSIAMNEINNDKKEVSK